MKVPALVILAILSTSTPAVGQRLEVPDAGPGRLKAERVRYDARTQTFYAEGNVVLSIGDLVVQAPRLRVDQRHRTVQATGGVVIRQSGTVLRGQELLYEISPRLAHVSGNVRLEQDGTAAAAGRMTLNIGAQVVQSRDGVRLAREGTTVTGDEMVAYLSTRRVEVAGRAVLVRPAAVPSTTQDRAARTLAAQETRITAERLRFAWDANEAEAEGAVVLTQPERTARAGKVVYSEARGIIELLGRVEIEQRSGEWLVEGGVAQVLKAPVHLRADRLVIRIETRDMQADGSWLRADKVVIAMADETFEATGNVETEFTVTRGK